MMEEGEVITWGSGSRADELKRDALAYELGYIIEDRGIEITQIQDILLHEDHCPFDLELPISNLLLDGIYYVVQHLQ